MPDWAATAVGIVLGVSLGFGVGRALYHWRVHARYNPRSFL